MTKNLFAYGTLLVPEIWELVVGKPFRSEAANLFGHEIFRVEGGDFPGIVCSESATSQVPGRIFYDLDEAAIARLDAYEDIFYERVEVEIKLIDSDQRIHCDTYLIQHEAAGKVLSNDPWTLEWFKAEAESAYISRMRGAGF